MARAAWFNRRTLEAEQGALLVDTGAESTCIALQVAQHLGLESIGEQETASAGGLYQAHKFAVGLRIWAMPPDDHEKALECWGCFSSEKTMYDTIIPGAVRDECNQSVAYIGLLGRDFLRHARLTYDGTTGLAIIEFDPSRMGPPFQWLDF